RSAAGQRGVDSGGGPAVRDRDRRGRRPRRAGPVPLVGEPVAGAAEPDVIRRRGERAEAVVAAAIRVGHGAVSEEVERGNRTAMGCGLYADVGEPLATALGY